jgi:hypothetical protein
MSLFGRMSEPAAYAKRYEDSAFIPAAAEDVFDYVDDHAHFYSHVVKFSRVVGGRMELQMDEGRGRSAGSHLRLSGKVLGTSLSLEEVITRREPPHLKAWETVGTPKFLVVGRYQWNVQIQPQTGGAALRVSLDYDPPAKAGWLRRLLSRVYMKLCAREMIEVTRNSFRRRVPSRNPG